MLKDLDKLPAACGWFDLAQAARDRIEAATDAELAAELRHPTAQSHQLREMVQREAFARLLERAKP